jgi:hypothetical protein
MGVLVKGIAGFTVKPSDLNDGLIPVKDGEHAAHKEFGVVRLTEKDGQWVYQRYGHAGYGDDLDLLTSIAFQVSTSGNGMNALELRDPDPAVRAFVRKSVTANLMTDLDYQLRVKAGAFLQCDTQQYVLVEFWQQDYQPFLDYLNENFGAWVERMHEIDLMDHLIEQLPR